MKLVIGVALFLLGIGVGAASLKAVEYLQSRETEVWTVTDELTSAGGVVIPVGTELVVVKYMPEGFVALNLGVNVEGSALSRFERRTEKAVALRIPQSVSEGPNEE